MPEKQVSAALSENGDTPERTMLNLKEAEVVKIILEFLNARGFHITMRALERESGLVNGLFSDDVLFLRHLVLDGQWEDVLQFIQPLETASEERYNYCRFVILRERYLEMLCMKNEKDLVGGGLGGTQGSQSFLEEFNIDEVVACLHSMERICPSREEYNSLCLLLTVQKLSDHPDFKNWNPSSARLQCFDLLRPVVEKILPADSNLSLEDFTASQDRLMQIVVHGLMYESCLDYCQSKAVATPVDMKQSRDSSSMPEKQSTVKPADVFAGVNVLRSSLHSEGDPSLISWLDECVPQQVFSAPFEQRDLTVNVGKIVKPPTASWFEQILLTPTPAQLTPGFTKSFPSPITSQASPCCSTIETAGDYNESIACQPYFNKSPNCEMFNSARPKTADKLSMSIDVCNLAPLDYHRSGVPGQHPNIQYLMPHSSAPARDVSKSYAHFSYKPLHSTIEEDNEEASNTPSYAPPGDSAIMNSNFETPRNTKWRDMNQSGLKVGQSSFQVRASTSMAPNHNQSQTSSNQSAIDCSFERLNLNVDRNNSIADDSLRHANSEGKNRNRQPNMGTREGLLRREFTEMDSQVTPTKSQNMQMSTPKPGLSGSVPRVRQSNNEPQRSQSSLSQTEQQQQKRLSGEINYQDHRNNSNVVLGGGDNWPSERDTTNDLSFTKSVVLNDVQAVRSVAFHPNGVGYAVGANTKVLRVFPSPNNSTFINFNSAAYPEKQQSAKPPVKPLWSKKDVHKGSIYCVDWSLGGELIATGSNDKMIKIIPVDPITQQLRGGCSEIELAMHDGTVRDVVFTSSGSGVILGSPLLVSGGAGDCNIYVTDCQQAKAMHAFAGHSGPILSLFSYGTHNLCSGSQDKTVRLWDIRSGKCTHVINTDIPSLALAASPACAVSVNGAGTLLAFGTEDAKVVLLDIRRAQFPHLATLDCHSSDVRSVRFAPSNPNYLLTGSYDSKLAVTYCGGSTHQSVIVGKHEDKVIQCRWNPSDLTFVSTSADRSACYWTLESNYRG